MERICKKENNCDSKNFSRRRVENIVGKGENEKLSMQGLTLSQTNPGFYVSAVQVF